VEHGDVEILGNEIKGGLNLRLKYRTYASELKGKTRFVGVFRSRV
jgi:hypothetical protein